MRPPGAIKVTVGRLAVMAGYPVILSKPARMAGPVYPGSRVKTVRAD